MRQDFVGFQGHKTPAVRIEAYRERSQANAFGRFLVRGFLLMLIVLEVVAISRALT